MAENKHMNLRYPRVTVPVNTVTLVLNGHAMLVQPSNHLFLQQSPMSPERHGRREKLNEEVLEAGSQDHAAGG